MKTFKATFILVMTLSVMSMLMSTFKVDIEQTSKAVDIMCRDICK